MTAYSFKVNQSTKPVSFVCLNFALFVASKHRPQQQNHSQTNIIHAVKCHTLFWFADHTISMKILLWNQHFFRWEKIVNFQTTNLCLIVSHFFHSTDLVHWFWIFVPKLELCSLQRIDTHSSFSFKLQLKHYEISYHSFIKASIIIVSKHFTNSPKKNDKNLFDRS